MDRIKEISERYSILRHLGSAIDKPTIEGDVIWLLKNKLERHFEFYKIFEERHPTRGFSIGFMVSVDGNEYSWSCNEEYFDRSPIRFHEIASYEIHAILGRAGLIGSPPNET